MSLWAITCYFNPARRASRLRNYRIFRSHLSVPLLTVELALHGEPELTADEADVMHQIRGGPQHILWQKERLLNLALARLPEDCTAVAWLDCDIVFANPLWAVQAAALLETHQLIQLFDRIVYLPREASDAQSMPPLIEASERWHWQAGAVSNALLPQPVPYPKLNQRGTATTGNTGMAWAAQRCWLNRHGFYDRAIVGGGDDYLFSAALDLASRLDAPLPSGTPARLDLDRWAQGLRADLQTPLAYVAGTIFHCWHGELSDRGYEKRHRGLAQFNFDPTTDIHLDDNGCWCWSSEKPDLHAYLSGYFQSRREDGSDGLAPSTPW